MGLPDRGAHMLPYNLWAPVGLLAASKRPVKATSLRVRKLAADREVAEGDLSYHRLSPGTAALGWSTTRPQAKLLSKKSIALNPPLKGR
jgi:hypothetical protein